MDQQERILIENACKGDDSAFEVLYLRHSKRIFALAYRMCENTATAQDVVQETMLKAWANLKRFRFQSEFGTWLYRIAMNTAKDKLRRAKRAPLSSDELRESGYEPAQDSFEESSIHREDLRHALHRLSPAHRQILLLRDAEDFSYEEIAQILSLPVGTVRSRINRAREQLRKYYLQEGTHSRRSASKDHKERTNR